ncbi:unnamed protein product [Phytomonas sp. EM1]|nr:unnamed protein product [Phytomonas sp. EM1]|eukprot:CCW61221.1 unnamed protein product [Phytomonas sp. isolate EM1]
MWQAFVRRGVPVWLVGTMGVGNLNRSPALSMSPATFLCSRRLKTSETTHVEGSTVNLSPDTVSPQIMPKRQKRHIKPNLGAIKPDSLPSDPGAHAETSMAQFKRKVEDWSKMNEHELDAAVNEFEAKEQESSRVLAEDSVYQMDVSLKTRNQSAVRVFWKDVDVQPLEKYDGWYTVLLDGRKVRAFESKQILAVPSEAMAYCCAQEYSEQSGYLNKLLMPMTDICSGVLHVAPQMIPPRIDYLMSFYQHDNMYFRSAPIVEVQNKLITPVTEWFSRLFEVDVPVVVGIGDPRIPPHNVMKVRDHLLSWSMNPYQIVALCVAAQFTSSLLLPLALFHGIVDSPTALRINHSEERHNITEAGLIEGYHDIREVDVAAKISACALAWKLMKDVPMAKCFEVPRTSPLDEADAI